MKLASFVATLITLARQLAVILLVLSGLLLAFSPWVDPPNIEVGFALPAAFRLDPPTQPVAIAPVQAEHVRLDDAQASLYFSPRNRVLVAASAAGLIALFAAAVWVLDQLRALLHTLRTGRPFAPANAMRLRRIAYGVIGAELVRTAVDYASTRYAMANFAAPGVQFHTRVDFNVVAILCGLMILLIAQAFREGARLTEEQSLTI